MSDVKVIDAPKITTVAVGQRVRQQEVQIKMINDRASHFYFKRTLSLLRSLGKYR